MATNLICITMCRKQTTNTTINDRLPLLHAREARLLKDLENSHRIPWASQSVNGLGKC